MRTWMLLTALLFTAPVTHAQTDVVIVAFEATGQLSWTNLDTNLYYRIEWAPALYPTQHWRGDYTGLMDVHSDQSNLTAFVPMFFRVVGGDQQLIPDVSNVRAGTIVQGINGTFWEGDRYRFGDSTDVVIDNKSGLMWVRRKGLVPRSNWYAAVSNCAELVYAGYDDWRLPTIAELQLLTDPTQLHPPDNLSGAQNPFINDQDLGDLNVWSSDEGVSTNAAVMQFSNDGVWNYPKTDFATVWPVRNASP